MARLCAHGCRGRLRLPCRHDVTHGRCNDAMSGQDFSDKVMVIADGETYRGCGGERRTDWDM